MTRVVLGKPLLCLAMLGGLAAASASRAGAGNDRQGAEDRQAGDHLAAILQLTKALAKRPESAAAIQALEQASCYCRATRFIDPTWDYPWPSLVNSTVRNRNCIERSNWMGRHHTAPAGGG